MIRKLLLLIMFSLISAALFAVNTNSVVKVGWKNIDSAHHISGPELTPAELNDNVVVVQRWCISCENIEKGASEFQSLAKRFQDTGIVFFVSYYPEDDQSEKEIESFLKKQKVTTPVYVGAQALGVKGSGAHRTMYVVKDGVALWQVKKDNTDIKPLMKFIDSYKQEWMEEAIVKNAESNPKKALEIGANLKKLNLKPSPETKKLLDTIRSRKK